MSAKDAAVAFRVSDDDLEIIDQACQVQMAQHPGTCSRNDIYRRGGLELAQRILDQHAMSSEDNMDVAA